MKYMMKTTTNPGKKRHWQRPEQNTDGFLEAKFMRDDSITLRVERVLWQHDTKI